MVLGDGDLHMVDVFPTPCRLEHPVGKTHGHDALDRLLAQKMVHPVELAFAALLEQLCVEVFRALQIVAEGLFDHHPAEHAVGFLEQPALAQAVRDDAEEPRRDRAIEYRAASVAELLGQVFVRVGLVEVRRNVLHFVRHPTPLFVVDLGSVELGGLVLGEILHRVRQRFFPALGVVLGVVEADDLEIVRQQTATREIVKRGHEQPLGEITSRAEDDQGTGGSLRGAGRAVVVGLWRCHVIYYNKSVCDGLSGFIPASEFPPTPVRSTLLRPRLRSSE